jgi:homoserine kinase type II
MVVGDTVSGLLDFEFCSYDWRAMELAVALSKYVGEAEPLELCERFVSGYVVMGQLTNEEIEVLPDLINLR